MLADQMKASGIVPVDQRCIGPDSERLDALEWSEVEAPEVGLQWTSVFGPLQSHSKRLLRMYLEPLGSNFRCCFASF